MSSEDETTDQIRRDARDTVLVSLGSAEVIPEYMTIEIGLADGRTVTIEGRRDRPRTGPDSGPKITGLDLPLGGAVEREMLAEELLIATAWKLCGIHLYDSGEMDRALAGEANE